MERIAKASASTTPGCCRYYLSRQDGADGEILTWDIRMKQLNKGSVILSPPLGSTRWSICSQPMRTASTAGVSSTSAPWAV